MSRDEVVSIVGSLDLPIEQPNSLYFRKNGNYVDSFDPVTEIEIWEHSINIKNGMMSFSGNELEYNLSFDAFDSIEVVKDGAER